MSFQQDPVYFVGASSKTSRSTCQTLSLHWVPIQTKPARWENYVEDSLRAKHIFYFCFLNVAVFQSAYFMTLDHILLLLSFYPEYSSDREKDLGVLIDNCCGRSQPWATKTTAVLLLQKQMDRIKITQLYKAW